MNYFLDTKYSVILFKVISTLESKFNIKPEYSCQQYMNVLMLIILIFSKNLQKVIH